MKRVRGLPVPKERAVQRQIVAGLRAMGFRAIAIPNGQKLAGSAEQRARMAIALRQEGLVAGFPDLLVLRPGHAEASFFEVKREGARLTGDHALNQIACHESLRGDGFRVAIVRSLDDVTETLKEWGWIA